nr:immunoglobulin light chain junction region [Macaca mulatta]
DYYYATWDDNLTGPVF